MDRLSIQFLATHLWFWVLLLLPAVALAFWAYYRILAPLSRPSRGVLWGLRAAAFALVLFALWQPILTAEIHGGGRPGLAVLLDRSASMALPSGGEGGATRSDAAAEARGRLAGSLRDRFRIDWYGFNDQLLPLEPDSLPRLQGGTALGHALEEVLVAAESRPVSGVVVISDGVNTSGRDPVRVAAAAPVPVFTVAVGPQTPATDAEIRSVRTNSTAFAGEPLPVRVVLSSWELGGRTARLEVRQAGEVLAAREVPLVGARGVEQEVTLEVRPTKPGLALYEVALAGVADSIPQNNTRAFAVEVLERKTRVLVLAGRLDWDFAFLRRALAADTTLGYSFLTQVRAGDYLAQGEARARRLPTTAAELREFAAVILVGYEDRGPPAATLEAIARFAREGGGVLLLGGPDRPGGWTAEGAFASILPGRIEAGPGRSAQALPVALTLEGQRHPATAMRDNPGEAARQWSLLPPVQQPGGALAVRPEGKTLLEFRGPRGAASPAMATVLTDRGKSGWIFARGVWRWGFLAAGSAEPTDLFPQLLLGLTRWLAEPAIRERFQVDPAKRVFQNGEAVALQASLWDETYAPVPGARVEVQLRSGEPGDTTGRPLVLQPEAEGGRYRGEFPPLPPGEYGYTATAMDASGRALGRTQGRLWVEAMGPEFSRTSPDREALAQIARRSGGEIAESGSLDRLLESIPQAVRSVGRLREWELWNHWLLFAAFVVLLSVEWFLRRRRGLA